MQVSVYVHVPPFLLRAAAQSLGSKMSLVPPEVSSQGIGIREMNISIPQHQEHLLLAAEDMKIFKENF